MRLIENIALCAVAVVCITLAVVIFSASLFIFLVRQSFEVWSEKFR